MHIVLIDYTAFIDEETKVQGISVIAEDHIL